MGPPEGESDGMGRRRAAQDHTSIRPLLLCIPVTYRDVASSGRTETSLKKTVEFLS